MLERVNRAFETYNTEGEIKFAFRTDVYFGERA